MKSNNKETTHVTTDVKEKSERKEIDENTVKR